MKECNSVPKPDHIDPIRPEECVYVQQIPDYVIETVNTILKDKFSRRNFGEVFIYENELKNAILRHPDVKEIIRQLIVDNPEKTQFSLEVEFIRGLRNRGGFDFAHKYREFGWNVQDFEDPHDTCEMGWTFQNPKF